MTSSSDPVTVVVAQQVKPGKEQAYETWVSDITQVASTYPGHLGTNVICPQSGIRSEYVVIFRFDTYENLKVWMESCDRNDWLIKAKPLIASEAKIQQYSGIEAWFSIPGQSLKTPPRYKTALLTGGAVYVLINVLNRTVTPLLQGVPSLLSTLIVTAIMVALLTYVIMPRVNRAFKPWLYG